MDMRKYSNGNYIKVEHVKHGPMQERIAFIKEGKFGKPDLHFVSGNILSLNATNNTTLTQHFGPNSIDWQDKDIENVLGEVKYQKKKQPAVIVKPISPALLPDEMTPLKPEEIATRPVSNGNADGMDDEIPF
jgi:hypothetical protein